MNAHAGSIRVVTAILMAVIAGSPSVCSAAQHGAAGQ
jgi:hypothetical protein